MSEKSNAKLKKLVPILLVFLVIGTVVKSLWDVGRNQGYAPVQPIPFSHKIHAGVNSIPCMYCHTGVNKSKHAGVPSMNVCMNCHNVVKADSPYIKKLAELYKKGESFQWVKVNDLPDHANFNHNRHIAKGVACTNCHGDVAKMDVVRQDKPLLMGWCLDCHRGKTAPDHLFASEPAASAGGSSVAGSATKKPHGQVAPTNCYTCHH